MEPIICPETSVWNYHSTLRKIPEERKSQILISGFRRDVDEICGLLGKLHGVVW
jgi:hypothetical protein